MNAELPVVVYWRRGCLYCRMLLRALHSAGIPVVERDIWADDDARRFVREHNGGDETVPTVAIGDWVATNPDPDWLVDVLQAGRAASDRRLGGGPDVG